MSSLLSRSTRILYAALVLLLGLATFIGQAKGTDFASEHIYHTWWFVLLWGFLAVLGIVALWRWRLWRRMAVFMLHVSLLIILLGSLVSFLTSREGTVHIREGATAQTYKNTSKGEKEPLPFAIRLTRFETEYYPGTQAPSDFVSHVEYGGKDGWQQAQISMNHILRYKGYRLYQSSFDPDQRGTVLTVNYDPYGTPLSYLGYALLGLSMVAVLVSRRESFVRLLHSPMANGGLAMLLGLLAMVPMSLSARGIPTINKEKAERVARMQVVYNNRVAPFNTLALDFVRKTYGKDTYHGLSAEQVAYGWMARPEAWKDEPMIRIKDTELRKELGISGQYASLSQLFDNGEYRLNRLVADGKLRDKPLRELDEKVGLIIMLTEGSLVQPLKASTPPLSDLRVSAELIYNRIPFCRLLFMVCLGLGVAGFGLLIVTLVQRRNKMPRMAIAALRTALWITFVVHLCGYLLRWFVSGNIPLGNGYETMQFMALMILAVTLLLERRLSLVVPFGFVLAGLTLLVAWLGQSNPPITPLMPVLASPLLSLHVSTVMAAYALLAFMMLNGLVALALSANNRDGRYAQQVEQLAWLSRVMLYPAVFLLATGIFLGAVWANVSWGKYWSWDPKEVWALITIMVYAVPLHQRSVRLLASSAHLHAYLVVAFLTVLMTYFGVNYFLGGMHSYA